MTTHCTTCDRPLDSRTRRAGGEVCYACATTTGHTTINFDTPDQYVEWHVIDAATATSIERCDEPDHALSHRAVAAGTAYVVEATVSAKVISHRVVTEDNFADEEKEQRP